jgi:hypothetical protein
MDQSNDVEAGQAFMVEIPSEHRSTCRPLIPKDSNVIHYLLKCFMLYVIIGEQIVMGAII